MIHRFVVFAERVGKLTGSVAACHKIKKPFIRGIKGTLNGINPGTANGRGRESVPSVCVVSGGSAEVLSCQITVEILHPVDHGRCLLYTSPSPRDRTRSRMPSSA